MACARDVERLDKRRPSTRGECRGRGCDVDKGRHMIECATAARNMVTSRVCNARKLSFSVSFTRGVGPDASISNICDVLVTGAPSRSRSRFTSLHSGELICFCLWFHTFPAPFCCPPSLAPPSLRQSPIHPSSLRPPSPVSHFLLSLSLRPSSLRHFVPRPPIPPSLRTSAPPNNNKRKRSLNLT